MRYETTSMVCGSLGVVLLGVACAHNAPVRLVAIVPVDPSDFARRGSLGLAQV